VKNRIQVFVSHTQADATLAHRLAADLAAAGLASWIAPDSIRPGEGWVDAINRGLAESTDVVVLLTPGAVDSMWVRQEVSAAIALERKGRLRLIPLEVEPCDVPPLWEAYQKISFVSGYESGARQLRAALAGTARPRGSATREGTRGASTGFFGIDRASLAELDTYARLYDAIYAPLPGDRRNDVLNAVFVDQLFQLGSATRYPPTVITGLFGRGSDGDRMVALVLLQTAPATDCLSVALDAIEGPRSPFEQYHGLRAVDLMTHMLSKSEQQTVIRVLDLARGKFLIPANRSRWEVYVDISTKLSAARAPAPDTGPAARATRRVKGTARASARRRRS
jgi:hypothetical protein